MNGYYFVLTEFISGRFGYSEQRFVSEYEAELCAASRRKIADVKNATVKYNPGQADVDIKRFV